MTTDDTLDGELSCSTKCQEGVVEGTSVTLTVTPASGYECELPQSSFVMTSPKTVTASCTKLPPALTADAGGG